MNVGSPADGPIAVGREADVYAVDERRVLRRYRHGGEVASEAAVMRYLHEHGYPVPEVYQAAGADLVLERLDGPTMGAALAAGELAPGPAGETLAHLHLRLHALPARRSTDPADRILHLDLHPDNVMLTSRGPVVIDWPNATEGPLDLDVALSALIMAEAGCGSFVPPPLAVVARELLAVFLARVGGDPLGQLDRAVARRADNPTLDAAETGRLAAAADLVRTSCPAGTTARTGPR